MSSFTFGISWHAMLRCSVRVNVCDVWYAVSSFTFLALYHTRSRNIRDTCVVCAWMCVRVCVCVCDLCV